MVIFAKCDENLICVCYDKRRMSCTCAVSSTPRIEFFLVYIYRQRYYLYYQSDVVNTNQFPSEGGTCILESFCIGFLFSPRRVDQFPQNINYVSHHNYLTTVNLLIYQLLQQANRLMQEMREIYVILPLLHRLLPGQCMALFY